MEALWTIFIIVIGSIIFARGYSALRNGEIPGRGGQVIAGTQAKILGWFFVVLGPLVALASLFSAITG